MIYLLKTRDVYPESILGYFTRKENALAAKTYEIWKPDAIYGEDTLCILEIPSYESIFEKVPGESWVSPTLVNEINEINEIDKQKNIDLSKDLLPNNKIYDIYHEHQTKKVEEMTCFQKHKEIRKAFFDQYFSDYYPKFVKEYKENDEKYRKHTIILEDMKTRLAEMKKLVKKKEIEQSALDDSITEYKIVTNKRGKMKSARTNTTNRFQLYMKNAYHKQFSENLDFSIDPKTDTTLECVVSSKYFDKRFDLDLNAMSLN